MKKILQGAWLLLACLFAIHTSLFARQGEGTITGTITDATTGESLPGASVRIVGTQIAVAADVNGRYAIRNLSAGPVKLQATYLGYGNETKDLTVTGQGANVANFALEAAKNTLNEVVVSGSLEGQQRALNQQRTADNIKNVISSDLIGRFPDLNVAEAMQRVPGVNINRDKGEGSEVSIRGTPPHFTAIQINGEQIPSAQQGGGRNEALDLIPADQLGSMEITKAPTADMDGDAIGGVINLKTPTARRTQLGVRAESALGYNDISGNLNGIGKLSLNQRFLATDAQPDGKLGVMLGGSYYSTNNSEERIDGQWLGTAPQIGGQPNERLLLDNYQYRSTINQRERIGATATLDYKFNNKHEIVFNYMYNRREDNDMRNRLRFDLARTSGGYQSLDSITGGRVRRDINIWDELKTNHSFNLQGFHKLDNWNIDWSAYYTLSKRDFSSDRGDFAHDGVTIIADNPGGIFADVPRFRTATDEQSIYNPLFYNHFRRFEDDMETTDANNLVTRIDVTKFLNLFDKYPAFLKFGGKVRSQGNSKFRDNRVFNTNNIPNNHEAFLRVISRTEPQRYLYDHDYRFGPLIGRQQFLDYTYNARPFLVTADDAWDAERLSLNDTYDAYEDIYAGYAMARVQVNKLTVLAGLRYEHNDVRYDAFDVYRSGTTVIGTPIQGGSQYAFLMPNVHLKYSLDEYTALRFSTVMNYARPNFVDIVPFVNYDVDENRLLLGNPDLQPARAWNFDLMFEKYFSNVGIFSVGTFYKDIDQFQFTRITPTLLEDFPGYPNTAGFRFEQEQNGENAKVAGVEVNFVKTLDFLPSVLSTLNVIANYTFAHSEAFTNDRTDISFPGQAPHTFNVALAWDYRNFTARLMGNYNGTFVHSLSSSAENDIYQDQRFQLDANASYSISKRWRVFGEWVNITNAPAVRYEGHRGRISRMAYFGWWSRFGIGFRL